MATQDSIETARPCGHFRGGEGQGILNSKVLPNGRLQEFLARQGPGVHPEISEAERFPLLTTAGRRLLHAMRQDSCAPIWNWPNGEQLDEAGLQRVREFAANLQQFHGTPRLTVPEWVPSFTDFCLEDVPFYRRRSRPGTPFRNIPSCCREDLATQVWEFVPDSQPLDKLIVFSSSGTTGHPAKLPTHPAAAASGVPLLELALSRFGHSFSRGSQSVALANIAAYPGAYTTAIVISYLNEAGCIRVNLCKEDWRSDTDCPTYLNRWNAPVFLGDPLAFAAFEKLRLEHSPQVLVSSIAHLTDAFAERLSARYGCPVIDLYALTEAGIVAMRTEHGHMVLPHDLYVEILNEFDEPCGLGERGEITLTGGRNPFGPLLRYRTGDFGSLDWHDGRQVIVGLEGRHPVMFATPSGRSVHSMEVSRLLRRFPLVQYQLHQDAEGKFRFAYRGNVGADDLRAALMELLDCSALLKVERMRVPATRRKVVEYHSECQIPECNA